jgi:hypothetical protein
LSILIGRLSGLDEFKKEKREEALRNLAGEMRTKPTPLIRLVPLAATGTTADHRFSIFWNFWAKRKW